MLVVSRKPTQQIVFPNLGISVEILRVNGKAVSVGVKAPEAIRILRGELTDAAEQSAYTAPQPNEAQHALRNQLNKATLALHLLQKQLDSGLILEAEDSLTAAITALADLDHSVNLEGLDRGVRPTGKKRRALIVEDDANERELLAGYLRLSGYEVDTVDNGVAALDYMSTRKPDAVVMDMHMPKMNGQETAQEIRNNPAWDDVPLYIVSGSNPDIDNNTTTLPSGVERWFQKPLRPDELVQHLAIALN